MLSVEHVSGNATASTYRKTPKILVSIWVNNGQIEAERIELRDGGGQALYF